MLKRVASTSSGGEVTTVKEAWASSSVRGVGPERVTYKNTHESEKPLVCHWRRGTNPR